jgi:hypothetical protein
MLTLAEITGIDVTSNLCTVRIPILEGTGNNTPVNISATMMLPPGIHGGYAVGDVVFLAFTDNNIGRPVILGQLYKGPITSTPETHKGNQIDNLGNVNDTLDVASAITCTDLNCLHKLQVIGSNNTAIDVGETLVTIESKLAALEQAISTLETRLPKL